MSKIKLRKPRPWSPWPLVLLPFIIVGYIYVGVYRVAKMVYDRQQRKRDGRDLDS